MRYQESVGINLKCNECHLAYSWIQSSHESLEGIYYIDVFAQYFVLGRIRICIDVYKYACRLKPKLLTIFICRCCCAALIKVILIFVRSRDIFYM